MHLEKLGRRNGSGSSRAAAGWRERVSAAIVRAKEALLFDFSEMAGEHGRVLRLALNEAEALAWQTEFPHLIFPSLAMEKARAAVEWHQRQRSLRNNSGEFAFAA